MVSLFSDSVKREKFSMFTFLNEMKLQHARIRRRPARNFFQLCAVANRFSPLPGEW
jgi:hypothetical protein